MSDRICCECGVLFYKPDYVVRYKRTFCSMKCYKADQAKKWLVKQCKVCGDDFKVRIIYNDQYSTCSKPSCRSANKTGHRNPNWRGGTAIYSHRRPERETIRYQTWREAVLERDKHRCVHCGCLDGLEVDHIKPWAYFPDQRYEVSNGRTLCGICHKKVMHEVFEWRDKLIAEGQIDPIYYHEPKQPPQERLCVICGEPFFPLSHNAITCPERKCRLRRDADLAKRRHHVRRAAARSSLS